MATAVSITRKPTSPTAKEFTTPKVAPEAVVVAIVVTSFMAASYLESRTV